MLEFLAEYGLFLLKVATIVIAIIVVIGFAAEASKRVQSDTLEVEKLNDKYRALAQALRTSIADKATQKQLKKDEKQRKKAESKSDAQRPRSYVIDFKGDLKASAVASLREEVTAILDVAADDDEVVMRLENHGGVVHEHGLAASQLARIRERGLKLTICVDKVAASGGYLMACVADRIIAAPFAILGSIGVLAQIPNFNRALESHGVDFEEVTAGKYKRTVTMFGKNTDEDREKLKADLEDVHELFKAAVARYRPELDLEQVATGEHWYGTRAGELGLIDEIGTSDDYLVAAVPDADIFKVSYRGKQTFQEKLMAAFESSVDRVGLWMADRQNRSQYH